MCFWKIWRRKRKPRRARGHRGQSCTFEVAVESALRLGRPNLTADINIYIFLNLSIFFYCGCTIFPDGLIWPLSVIQNPEEISKLKRIKRKGKKKKWWNCPWRRGREGGGFDGGGSCFVAVCGTSCCSPLSPLKMLHTLVKHTVSPSHCCSDLLWGGLKKKKKNRFRREKEDCTYNRIL